MNKYQYFVRARQQEALAEAIAKADAVRIQLEKEKLEITALDLMHNGCYKYIDNKGVVNYNITDEFMKVMVHAVNEVTQAQVYIMHHLDDIKPSQEIWAYNKLLTAININHDIYLRALMASFPVWDERKKKTP